MLCRTDFISIPSFPGYFATKDGGIWSNKRGKLKRRSIKSRDKKGYLHLQLRKNSKSYTKKLHTLILTAFLGPRPKGMQCRHLDGNKENNKLINLCWGTQSENQQDAVKHGTHKSLFVPGEKHKNAKLNWFLVRTIRDLYKTKMITQKELAEIFDVSRSTISKIIKCDYWRIVE